MEWEHSYWIPTNRNVRVCIESYIMEIDYWYKLSGNVIPVFILDSGNQKIEQENSNVVDELAKKYVHLSIHHVSLKRQREVIAHLLRDSNLSPSLIDLIAPATTNYGAVMNKIAIFAAMIGSNFIHRRDSDTTLQPNCPSPLEFEMLALRGKKNKEIPVVVGGGYVGEWNMDLKPFIEVSSELFSVFWSCLGVDESLHHAIYEKLDGDSHAIYRNDSINYTDKNGFFLPDAGNVAVSNYYKIFPCLPSNAMSSDYSLFRFARGFGLPMVYHERRVVHEYHKERGANIDGYLTSLLKYCDLRPIYSELENKIEEGVCSLNIKISQNPQKSIANILQQLSGKNSESRKEKLREFLTRFVAPRYPDWANKTQGALEFIFNECNQDYQNHISLLLHWQQLINAAAQCRQDVKLSLFDNKQYELAEPL